MTEHPHRPSRRFLAFGIGGTAVTLAVVVAAMTGSFAPTAERAPGSASATAPTSVSPTPTPTSTAKAPSGPEYVQIPALAGATGAVESTTVTVSPEETGTALAEGLMGFSFEADTMADPRFEPGASTFVTELKKLHKPVIRFGGQAVDRRFFWTSTDEPIPTDWKLVPAFKGDKRPIVKVAPADLQRLNRMAQAADARLLLTADLGHYDPARAADFAKNAAQIFGDRLIGMTIGNEPNGYLIEGNDYLTLRPVGWDAAKFATEFNAYAAEIKKSAPSVRLVGPGTFNLGWLMSYTSMNLAEGGALSFHHYPMSGCGGPNDPNGPTIARTMSRERSDQNRDFLSNVMAVANRAKAPLWLTESGLSSCSGSNETSRKHVSALWGVGYSLMAAEIGVTEINIHSALEACKGGPPSSPLCDSGAYRQPNGVIVEQSNYFGMLMVSALQPGKFHKVDQSGSANIYSYAIAHQDGSMSVVVVNQNDPAKFGQAPVTIQLPRAAVNGTMSQMTGPTFDAEGMTRIDGRDDSGVPVAERATIPGFVQGQKSVSLPLTSGTATVLTFTF